MRFPEWFASSIFASWLRTFIAIMLAMFVADGADLFAIDATDLRGYVAAACAAVLPAVVRWLNPADVEFGRGAIEFQPFDVWDDEDEDDK
jgi:hypothetical protein